MAIGRPIPVLTLIDEERDTLERWARRPTTAQALAQRARLVLTCASGRTNTQVARELRLGVAALGRVAPAVPAQVGADHAVAVAEPRDDLAPAPPVLRPAVQHHDRLGAGVAGLGHVHPEAVDLVVVVADAVEFRKLGEHGGRDY